MKILKERIILHIDMDYFFAQIEERENPQFKNKAVVVGANPKKGKGRGVVSTANYEARKYGIYSAMPISQAYQLCPKAIFLPVNIDFYRKVSKNIMEIIKKYSPKWEIVSLDEAYLDLSFLIPKSELKEPLYGYQKAKNLAKKLKKEILKKEKLTATIGIGPNKLIAKMACEKAKPDGLLVIKPSQVKEFLDLLDIKKLPGIGPKTAEKLRKQIRLLINRGENISERITIRELKQLSKRRLVILFGKAGEAIYKKARGIDQDPVSCEKIIKSVGRERTFEKDTRNPEIIFETFEKIIKDTHQELIRNKLLFKTITVVCRFQDFETRTKSKTLKENINNLKILEQEAKKLLLKFLIENPKLIRLIGLRVTVALNK